MQEQFVRGDICRILTYEECVNKFGIPISQQKFGKLISYYWNYPSYSGINGNFGISHVEFGMIITLNSYDAFSKKFNYSTEQRPAPPFWDIVEFAIEKISMTKVIEQILRS